MTRRGIWADTRTNLAARKWAWSRSRRGPLGLIAFGLLSFFQAKWRRTYGGVPV